MSDEVRDNVRNGKDPGGRFILPEIVKGYGVTLREFFTKPSTMKYPEEKWTVPPRYRGYPRLLPNEDGSGRCVACGLCAVVCPPMAIQLTAGETEKPKERYPVTFEIHMGRCINCGMCAEACPKEAIGMSSKYELNTPELDSLIYRRDILVKGYDTK